MAALLQEPLRLLLGERAAELLSWEPRALCVDAGEGLRSPSFIFCAREDALEKPKEF